MQITIKVGDTKVTLVREPGGGHSAQLGDAADVLVVAGRRGQYVLIAVAQIDWKATDFQAHCIQRTLGLTAQDAADDLDDEAIMLIQEAA